ncbi:hypothetical protein KP509_07G091800 [Ceratopteris richardii]|uniref:Uncharacterized protein n=1 Tax=Ceratopteris richardii TaxID=49495 RepID=A0A8T2UKP0_CERRI|nr:hypothetical protein KP509_07G091800 [Ceratopteris richardii]KAH7433905.1 hypothetical protein KP509_07G091800 [Ceratopteris richardii]
MRSSMSFHLHIWRSSQKLAEKYVVHAMQLISSHDPADIHSALNLLDAALNILPQWHKALEMKARALLCLRRFRDVINMLRDSIPILEKQPTILANSMENLELLNNQSSEAGSDITHTGNKCFFHCFPVVKFKKKLIVSGISDCDQWKWIVLGQACCHLGMMEDAMFLLSNWKRVASTAFRKHSFRSQEDAFCSSANFSPEYDLVNHLLCKVKVLVRRRKVAVAAFQSGRYAESVKQCSKILDGRKAVPQGFLSECFLLRAKAYQAHGKFIDAIADCNRTLILNPLCVEGLSIRATLFETIGCLQECASDLSQIKALYAPVLQSQRAPKGQIYYLLDAMKNTDLEACFGLITNKLAAVKEHLSYDEGSTLDCHSVLGVSKNCCRSDVERAHVLLSLRHNPEKATDFMDHCEFVDEREIDYIKDEANTQAEKFFQLIQRAYDGIMCVIAGDESRR